MVTIIENFENICFCLRRLFKTIMNYILRTNKNKQNSHSSIGKETDNLNNGEKDDSSKSGNRELFPDIDYTQFNPENPKFVSLHPSVSNI